MKKRITSTLPIAALLVIMVAAGALASAAQPAGVLPQPGEKLSYEATWGSLPAGSLTMEVLPMTTVKGVPAYHFAMTTRTNNAVDVIYRVREREESYIDTKFTHSLLYTKKTEGKHPRDVVVDFNWEKSEATRSNFGEKMTPVRIVPGSFDPLALFFILRVRNIGENAVVEIPLSEGDNNFLVRARVEKRERLRVKSGDYDTFLVIPDMESLEAQKVFKKNEVPQLILWVTADERRIPVKIMSKVGVGYFVFELADYQP